MVGKKLGSLSPSVSSLQQCVKERVGYLKFPVSPLCPQDQKDRAGF